VDIWDEIFAEFFCVGKVRFCWGFWGNWGAGRGFLVDRLWWIARGRWFVDVRFLRGVFLQFFRIYFGVGSFGNAWRKLLDA
jgi:hypothetical protein